MNPTALLKVQVLSRGTWHPYAGDGAILPEDAAIGCKNGRWAFITADCTSGTAQTEEEAKKAAAVAVTADVFRRWGFPALAKCIEDGREGAGRVLAAILRTGGKNP